MLNGFSLRFFGVAGNELEMASIYFLLFLRRDGFRFDLAVVYVYGLYKWLV